MEYDFLVHPGGKTSDISMKWNGMEKIERLKGLKIEYSFALGKMEESKAVSFQSGNEIPSHFTQKGSFIGFHIDHYDHSKNLLIDPVLDWSTYYGGEGDDVAQAMAADNQGNIFIVGQTFSKTGIASPGAFLIKNDDSNYVNDIGVAFLVKFSPSGTRLWGTYYGGFGNAGANGVATDSEGNVIIIGEVTTIDSGIATQGAYQTSQPAGAFEEAFVAKFSPGGSRLWGTFFGQNDIGTQIAIDASNNIIIAGSTADSGMGTAGVYKPRYSYAHDSSDAFVAKLSPSGDKTWFTYFGGRGQDGCSGITLDPYGNIFTTGITNSDSGIASTGAFQTEPGYIFLAKFSSIGSLDWSTYFGHGTGDDVSGIASDHEGNAVFTGGFSDSSDFHMATSGAYQTSFINMYVAKFSPSGSRTWCTYYGNSSFGYSGGIATDINNNIFLTGKIFYPGLPLWVDSGIATSGAYQTLDNYLDLNTAFLTEFSPSGGVNYATYFGGESGTQGKSICTFSPGLVYLMGITSSSDDIATSGAYQTSFAGGNLLYGNGDAFIAKFDFTKSGIEENNPKETAFSIYPNPASNHIILNASGLDYGVEICTVYDVFGHIIKTYTFYPKSGILNKEIDVSGCEKGVYYVELVQGENRYVQKLVVE